MQPLRPYKRPATGRQFQPGDPKVLRFFGKWVDTKASKEGSRNTFDCAKFSIQHITEINILLFISNILN